MSIIKPPFQLKFLPSLCINLEPRASWDEIRCGKNSPRPYKIFKFPAPGKLNGGKKSLKGFTLSDDVENF